MIKRLLLLSLLAIPTIQADAQTPVWSTDIAPILFNNCASCHRPSGIAPFSVLTFNDAVTRSASIAASVSSGYMPPWPPNAKYNRLAHERLLSQKDIKKIQDWVAGGKPQGDPNLAPPQPAFNPNGDLPGTPDMVTRIPTFTSTATTGDVYQCFVVPSGLSADKYVSAFEAIPGNRDVVHHVLVYADTTGICAGLDAAHNGPGYVSFGGVGTDAAMLLGGWVPGTQPMKMPDSFGVRIPKNADIVVQIHYPKGSNGTVDSTKINFYFSSLPQANLRPVRIDPVLNHMGAALCTLTPGGSLTIPANQTKKYVETSPISGLVGDISLLGIAPHMHLIGRKINAYGVLPTKDTIKLIDIPNWDFSWQGFYMFRKITKLPAGTDLYSEAFYDNTTNNPFNPSNPPQVVNAGEETTDEMMLTFFIWAYYQPGDENKFIDPSTPVELGVSGNTAYAAQELFMPYPNPSNGKLYIKYFLQQAADVTLTITDMSGKVVKQLEAKQSSQGYHVQPYDVTDIATGNYLLQLRSNGKVATQKISVMH